MEKLTRTDGLVAPPMLIRNYWETMPHTITFVTDVPDDVTFIIDGEAITVREIRQIFAARKG